MMLFESSKRFTTRCKSHGVFGRPWKFCKIHRIKTPFKLLPSKSTRKIKLDTAIERIIAQRQISHWHGGDLETLSNFNHYFTSAQRFLIFPRKPSRTRPLWGSEASSYITSDETQPVDDRELAHRPSRVKYSLVAIFRHFARTIIVLEIRSGIQEDDAMKFRGSLHLRGPLKVVELRLIMPRINRVEMPAWGSIVDLGVVMNSSHWPRTIWPSLNRVMTDIAIVLSIISEVLSGELVVLPFFRYERIWPRWKFEFYN